jgi:hypothetical protein
MNLPGILPQIEARLFGPVEARDHVEIGRARSLSIVLGGTLQLEFPQRQTRRMKIEYSIQSMLQLFNV